ncbi:hypothetical protein FGIG_08256 [Fasciola gigantica]|uniref:Uncharacterized protein n=1 Tax=Fasciola gigantica TaxID=46835 RepID=A0A504YHS5_FASGI|nr:hypothetical protein FGIG_08256 [Fasciola gigantica]
MHVSAVVNTFSVSFLAISWYQSFYVPTSAENNAQSMNRSCQTKPCCLRGRNICDGLKITLGDESTNCDAFIKNNWTSVQPMFSIELGESLDKSVHQYENASIIYAAINIPLDCFDDKVGCRPKIYIWSKIECDDDEFDHVDRLHLILFRQMFEFDISHLPNMVKGTYPYAEFYRGALWYPKVLRCHRYLWYRCVRHPKYNVYMRTEIGEEYKKIEAYEDIVSNQISNKLLEQFKSVIITPKMVHLPRSRPSLEDALDSKSDDCTTEIETWSLFTIKLRNTSFRQSLVEAANTWYIEATHQYVHLRMFHQFSNNYLMVMKHHDSGFIKQRMDYWTQKITRMIARLQLIFDIFIEIGFPWDPPMEHFRELELDI